MQLDADTVIKFISLGLSLAAIVYAFFANRGDRMDRQERRIAALEQTVKSLPAKEDVHNLQIQLVRMEGNAKVMSRMETIVSRHEDHLLGGNR